MRASGEETRRTIARLEAALPDNAEAAADLAALVERMDRYDHDRDGPVREIMARVGDRWSTLILLVLRAGTFRHATLRRLVATLSAEGGISQRMLTLKLRALERDGLVAREVVPTVPPQVSYSLTPLGAELVEIVDRLLRWIEAHNDEIAAARRGFAADE